MIIPYPVRTGKHLRFPGENFFLRPAAQALLRLTYPTPYATFLRTDFHFLRSEKVPFFATGKYLPNRIVFFFRQALEGTMGRTAVDRIWLGAGPRDECLLPVMDDLEKAVDFSCFSALCSSIEKVYGEEGARAILHRSGRMAFSRTLRSTAALVGLEGPHLYAQSGSDRISAGLLSVTRLLSLLSDMECSVASTPQGYRFSVTGCPECAGRTCGGSLCHSVAGMLRGALDWFGIDPGIPVVETDCIACGAAGCNFSISDSF